jgi:cytochrome c nitrite reductase small subunit
MHTGTLTTLVVGAAVGAIAGIAGYTFVYAKGASYLTDAPTACANCHIMNEQFDGWSRSSHRAVAVCNDCHTPPGPARKYLTKAINGFNHSVAFTTGRFPEPIQITPRNKAITEEGCRTCHEDIVVAIDQSGGGDRRLSCIRCHASVGHL